VRRPAAWRHGRRRRSHRHAPVQHDEFARNLAISDEPARRRPADGRAIGSDAEAVARASHPAQSAAKLKTSHRKINSGSMQPAGKRMSSYSEDLHSAALAYHRFPKPGQLEIQAIKPLANQRDLALAYSPGVAAACTAIANNPAEAASLTTRANLVAVVSNGTAVLGLGNSGPLAS